MYKIGNIMKKNQISYIDVGKKNNPVIILLHGFFMDGRMFQYQVDALKDEYRLICCDFRGFGTTEWDKKPFDFDDLVDDVIGVLEHLKVEKCTVIGMSMGGYVAQRLALYHPNLVSSLILIATQASKDNKETIKAYHQLLENWSEISTREKIITSLLPVIIGEYDNESRYWEKVWLDYDYEDIHYPMIAMTSRNDIDVSQLKLPCLIIHGRNDIGIPLSAATKLHEDIINSNMVIVDGACHAVNLTHPDIVNNSIKAFLAETRF